MFPARCSSRKHRHLAGQRLSGGLCVPSLLHRFKLDPKIAAGPVTLASGGYFCARDLFHERLAGFAMSAVSVIIPALNEAEPIAGVVHEVAATKIPADIIVVDNGSTDRTAERARNAGARVVSEPVPVTAGGAWPESARCRRNPTLSFFSTATAAIALS